MNIGEDGILVEPRFRSNLGGSPRTRYPLHVAAAKYDGDELQRILKESGCNPNDRNGDGETALHVLLSDEFGGHYFQSEMEECLRLLIGAGGPDLINALDNKDESAISLAVHHGFQSAALELVRNGADTTIMTGKFPGMHSLASKIAKTMPNVMQQILDSGIVPNGEQGQSANVALDWRKLLQYPSSKDGVSLPRETSFLYSLLDHPVPTRGPYLKHPLVSAFLHLRVNKGQLYTGKRINIYLYQIPIAAWLILYLLFVNLYFFEKRVPEGEEVGSAGTNYTEVIPTSTEPGYGLRLRLSNPHWFVITCAIILFLSMAVVGLGDIRMLFTFDLQYLKSWRMWVIRIAYCFMGISLWGPILGALIDSYDSSLIYFVTAMGIFFGWALLLLQVELFFPHVKLYVEMLATIAKSVLKTIGLFFLLFLGFYEGFRFMYRKNKSLVEFFLIALDVTSITSEYEEVSERCKLASWCWPIVFSISFRIVFIVVVGIVFINFLIAVAISDIQKLKEGAEIKALSYLLQNVFIVNIFFRECFNVVSRRDRENEKWTFTYHPSKWDCPGRAKFSEKIRKEITDFLRARKLLELEVQREANNNNIPLTTE